MREPRTSRPALICHDGLRSWGRTRDAPASYLRVITNSGCDLKPMSREPVGRTNRTVEGARTPPIDYGQETFRLTSMAQLPEGQGIRDRKSTRLNSSHLG